MLWTTYKTSKRPSAGLVGAVQLSRMCGSMAGPAIIPPPIIAAAVAAQRSRALGIMEDTCGLLVCVILDIKSIYYYICRWFLQL